MEKKFGVPTLRPMTPAVLRQALSLGFRDFRAAPHFGLIFAAFYIIVGWLMTWVTLSTGTSFWLVLAAIGFPLIGPVSGFMGLLWIIPLFALVYAGEVLAERKEGEDLGSVAVHVGGLSLIIFGLAEATLTLIPVWSPVGVTSMGPVALYVLVPEAILGASAWWGFRLTENRSAASKLGAALLVMLGYILTLTISYRLIEGPLP